MNLAQIVENSKILQLIYKLSQQHLNQSNTCENKIRQNQWLIIFSIFNIICKFLITKDEKKILLMAVTVTIKIILLI